MAHRERFLMPEKDVP